MTAAPGKLERAGAWLSDHWARVIWYFATGAVGVLSALSSDEANTLLGLPAGAQRYLFCAFLASLGALAIATVLDSWQQFKREKALRKLADESDDLRKERDALLAEVGQLKDQLQQQGADWTRSVRNILNGYLLAIGQHRLGFGEQGKYLDRLSLYVLDEPGHFALMARVSPNPVFSNASQRKYRNTVGVIGKAWQNGQHFANGFCDCQADANSYQRQQVADGLSHPEARGLKMKSRLYFGQRLDVNGTPYAVLVLESIDPDRYPSAFLERFFEQERRAAEEVLRHLVPYMPSPAVAAAKGL